jgi:hypothetical protein
MVFVPADMSSINYDPNFTANAAMVTNLLDAPYRGYALYVGRTVGDQPGRSTAGYESEWKRLPNGVIFQLDQYDFARDSRDDREQAPEARRVRCCAH